MPGNRQDMAGRGALEQLRPQLLLQPVQPARDGGVVHLQAARGLLCGLGAHHGEKQTQVVPVGVFDGHSAARRWCKFAMRICLKTVSICRSAN
ncbi:hypothetical protein SDC9_184217 [bioreactor metagenome]|uniref:Uncharacterized protein n=1 Tax=bioreactor metagenome TaxID=1076179 RepID=A0A645HCF3_9ZZZZ